MSIDPKAKITDCFDAFQKFKGHYESDGSYVDCLGFKYSKYTVGCADCMFQFRQPVLCVIRKELDEENIEKSVMDVSRTHECKYFLIDSFSEGDDIDTQVEKQVYAIGESFM